MRWDEQGVVQYREVQPFWSELSFARMRISDAPIFL